ncbi:MAG TPA: hypothetical protein VFE81_10530 [Paraburkholderia sp.]|nr:hypothetical protein [Paraburkholderia sp.]
MSELRGSNGPRYYTRLEQLKLKAVSSSIGMLSVRKVGERAYATAMVALAAQ